MAVRADSGPGLGDELPKERAEAPVGDDRGTSGQEGGRDPQRSSITVWSGIGVCSVRGPQRGGGSHEPGPGGLVRGGVGPGCSGNHPRVLGADVRLPLPPEPKAGESGASAERVKTMVMLAHQIRLEPNRGEEEYFRKACGISRFAWNWGLSEWKRRCDSGGFRKEASPAKSRSRAPLSSCAEDHI